ncbi:hypothetical protein AAVH_08123 [Aphelenchoides avenae]|nr:hypothetical protein AAVH_08123 [Aphelenchus avenae]
MDRHDFNLSQRKIDALERSLQEHRSELANVRALNRNLTIENAELKKQAQRLKNNEAEHSSALGTVESLRKQLVAKSIELNSAKNMLVLGTEARREADEQRAKLAKAHESLRERFRAVLQQVSDLKTHLGKAKGDTLAGEKEATKRQLRASEDRLKETEMTRLRLALDAKNAELEEQRRLVEILRDQFHALGASNDEKSGPSEALPSISTGLKGLADSLQQGFVEHSSADDSGLGSDVVPPSPVIETIGLDDGRTQQSLRNAAANGNAEDSSIVIDSSSRAMSKNHPVLSRLLQQPSKPLKTAAKRPNFLQLACNKPAKQPRVDPNAR